MSREGSLAGLRSGVIPLRGTGRVEDPGLSAPRELDPRRRRLGGLSPPVTDPRADRAPESLPTVDPVGPRALRGFGLSSREAKLYLTLIVQGPQDARRVTEGSGLHRATGYRILARLLARGLARSDRRWPREYSAVPLRVLVERNVMFLRDEIELRHWLVQTFPGGHDLPSGGLPAAGADDGRRGPPDPANAARASATRLTAMGTPSDSILLTELEGARNEVVALVRPRMISPDLRGRVAASLVRIATEGHHVRLVLDYLTADRRFASQLRREASLRGPSFELRHFTPLGAHLYVIDGRVAVRFPALAGGSREAGFGFVTRDPYFVRAQIARFEAVWVDAVARRAAPAGSPAPSAEGFSHANRFSPPPDAAPRWSGAGPRSAVR